MNTIKDTKNSLLNRRELKVVVQSESNPGFAKALELIAEKFKSAIDTIVVNNVKGKFGRNTFLIDAFVYNSSADKTKVEQKPKVKKNPAEGAK
jgi:ribosomal protein S24E